MSNSTARSYIPDSVDTFILRFCFAEHYMVLWPPTYIKAGLFQLNAKTVLQRYIIELKRRSPLEFFAYEFQFQVIS